MTTQDKELRELAEEALRTQTQYTMSPNIGRMNSARAAKDALLDRIDRLEAENKEANSLLMRAACSGIREKFMQEAVERHLLKGTP